ncbi:MAG: hypothetical protein KDE31_22525, partial [Caldilineaceae bacterium]|nr:hypothetical protein [Caldilineaceae bacterium]
AVNWMAEQVGGMVAGEKRQLLGTEQRLARLHPQRMLDQRRQQLDDRERRLHSTARGRLERLYDRVEATNYRLEALNPLRVMARGYSIVQHQDGRVVSDPADVAADEMLRVRAAGGSYDVSFARRVDGAKRVEDRA